MIHWYPNSKRSRPSARVHDLPPNRTSVASVFACLLTKSFGAVVSSHSAPQCVQQRPLPSSQSIPYGQCHSTAQQKYCYLDLAWPQQINAYFGLPRRRAAESSTPLDLVSVLEACLGVVVPHSEGPPMPSIPELGMSHLLSGGNSQRQSTGFMVLSFRSIANGA